MDRLNSDHPIMKKQRKEVLGTQIVKHTPVAYWILSARDELGITNTEWQAMSLSEKGEAIAYVQLKNMTETIRFHIDTLERNREEMTRESLNRRRG